MTVAMTVYLTLWGGTPAPPAPLLDPLAVIAWALLLTTPAAVLVVIVRDLRAARAARSGADLSPSASAPDRAARPRHQEEVHRFGKPTMRP